MYDIAAEEAARFEIEEQVEEISYLSQFSLAQIIDSLPENYPLIKDSGLWTIFNDECEEVIFEQRADSDFETFIRRYAAHILGSQMADLDAEETLRINLATTS